jgi:hypothetical protein
MVQPASSQPRRGAAAGSAGRDQPPAPRRRVLRRQAVVRRIDPWSVLKLSLIFYFFLLLVGMLGFAVIWGIISRLGGIDQALALLEALNFQVQLNMGNIARALFLVGVLQVILLSGVNVFLAFLYNLVADLLGGLKITLAEEEKVRESRAVEPQPAAGEARAPSAPSGGLQRPPAGGNGGGATESTRRLQ